MVIRTERVTYDCYLGDSVYAGWDGMHVWLCTHNGYPDDPRNEIALDVGSVYPALQICMTGIYMRIKEEREAQEQGYHAEEKHERDQEDRRVDGDREP